MNTGLLIAQACLLALDGWLFFGVQNPVLLVIAGHLFAAMLFAPAFRACLGARCPSNGAYILALILVLFIPVAGMGCVLMMALLLLYKPLPEGDLLGEFQEHTTLPDIADAGQNIIVDGKALLQDNRSVEPLVDMLSTPDPQLKRAILEAIAQRNNPKLIPYILEALEDPRPEIYQFAIAKMTELQHNFGLEITRATDAVSENPGDIESHHRLAGVYSRYLNSGLVDTSVEGFYRDQLRAAYEKILAISPGEITTLKNLGRMLSETGSWEEAGDIFKKALDVRPNDLEAKFGLIKVLYEKKKYTEMFELLGRAREEMAAGVEADPKLRQLAEWWMSPDIETYGVSL